MLNWLFIQLAQGAEPTDYIAKVEGKIQDDAIHLRFDDTPYPETIIKKRALAISNPPWVSVQAVATVEDVSQWIDSDVIAGDIWEYKIIRQGEETAEGYITVAYEAEVNDYRGKAVLLIDSSMEEERDIE